VRMKLADPFKGALVGMDVAHHGIMIPKTMGDHVTVSRPRVKVR